ncbi:Ninein-like protein [Nibea albiflora]|uniref:Ninein-like protein n=1 Tax=Nibea albiflora TaxID=240163 RepID=A0ACB7EET9_NIBAL|nr:Ninein-like protein [Nibea albiflora]
MDEEKEEVCRLSQENRTYARLADQLSTQIVEMEEEISTLRDHLRALSSQLNGTADLVLDLRRQLNAKTSTVDQLRAEVAAATIQEVLQLQRALQDSQNQQRTAEEDFEQEKTGMTQQLMELEKLVLVLEEVMDPASPHRTQLEEVRSENGALQERLSVLQQEVQNLEDSVAKKRRKLEEVERENERGAEKKRRGFTKRYREEVLDLSSRNLQLSNDNAELSARLRGDQESVRMLQERLASVSKEQEEEGASVRRLQDAAMQHEREKLQQQAAWTQEKQLMERELSSYKEKLVRLSELEAELSTITLKLQWLEDDKSKLLRDADDRNNKVRRWRSCSRRCSPWRAEAELLRSQLHAVNQDKLSHAQEVSDTHRKLHNAQNKVSHNVQLTELQVQSVEVQKLTQEQQNLKTKLNELETERAQAQNQAQHLRRLQELQERAGDGSREQVELLQARLEEEHRRSQQLEEALRLQAQQSSSQISMKQDQYEKALSGLQQRMEEMETKLKGARLVLQEKVQQLKEQVSLWRRMRRRAGLLKDLYVENSELMKALQVTEQRQKNAEKKNFLLEAKVNALHRLLREVVPAALAT